MCTATGEARKLIQCSESRSCCDGLSKEMGGFTSAGLKFHAINDLRRNENKIKATELLSNKQLAAQTRHVTARIFGIPVTLFDSVAVFTAWFIKGDLTHDDRFIVKEAVREDGPTYMAAWMRSRATRSGVRGGGRHCALLAVSTRPCSLVRPRHPQQASSLRPTTRGSGIEMSTPDRQIPPR